MKKLYPTLLLMTAVACTAYAADNTSCLQSTMTATQPSQLHEAHKTPTVRPVLDLSPMHKPATWQQRAPRRAHPTSTYDKWGQGRVRDGVMDMYTDMRACDTYTVDYYRNSADDSWLRLTMWPAASQGGKLLGANTVETYVNIADPDQVYCEDFKAFGKFEISQIVPENNWSDENINYGKLRDNIVTFGQNSFALMPPNDSVYNVTNRMGKFKLLLPGAKDYTLELFSSHWCTDDVDSTGHQRLLVNLVRGGDIATLKYIWYSGWVEDTDTRAQTVANSSNASTLEAKYNGIYFNVDKDDVNTMAAVGLDASGKIASHTTMVFYGLKHAADDANWSDFGQAELQRNAFKGVYANAKGDVVKVAAQRSTVTPGLYRLVDPYATYTEKYYGAGAISHGGHSHYIIVDATDPDHAYVCMSPLGYDYNNGEVLYGSYAGYLKASYQDVPAEYYGTFKNRVLQMPANSMVYGEKAYQDGTLYFTPNSFKVTFDREDAIEDLATAEAYVEAPAQYFNLQGQRIDNPAPGQLVIVRQNGKTTKQLVR